MTWVIRLTVWALSGMVIGYVMFSLGKVLP